jgi:hypothetical protein
MNEASAVAVKPAAVVIKMRLRVGVEQASLHGTRRYAPSGPNCQASSAPK